MDLFAFLLAKREDEEEVEKVFEKASYSVWWEVVQVLVLVGIGEGMKSAGGRSAQFAGAGGAHSLTQEVSSLTA